MPRPAQKQTSNRRRESAARKRKNYRILQSKLDTAMRILGTRTETETIEKALDLVGFGERLAAGTERARGRAWNDVFAEMKDAAGSSS
jgi:hypothetical protein